MAEDRHRPERHLFLDQRPGLARQQLRDAERRHVPRPALRRRPAADPGPGQPAGQPGDAARAGPGPDELEPVRRGTALFGTVAEQQRVRLLLHPGRQQPAAAELAVGPPGRRASRRDRQGRGRCHRRRDPGRGRGPALVSGHPGQPVVDRRRLSRSRAAAGRRTISSATRRRSRPRRSASAPRSATGRSRANIPTSSTCRCRSTSPT